MTNNHFKIAANKGVSDSHALANEMLTRNPANSYALSAKGYAFIEDELYQQAKPFFVGAIRKNSKNHEARYGLALIYGQEGLHYAAERQLRIAIKQGCTDETLISRHRSLLGYLEQYGAFRSSSRPILNLKKDLA